MHRFLTVFEETATEAPTQATLGDMSGMLSLILLLMLFGGGAYALYTYIRLRRTCMLFPNKFLYPGNCTADTCVDVDGFIDYILPRLLLLGVGVLLCGVAYLVYALVLKASNLWVDIAALVVPTGIFIWYMFVQRKAAKEFW